jgi:hypothetical protein
VFDGCVNCSISNARVGNFGINGVNVTAGANFVLSKVNMSGTGQVLGY